MKYILDLKLEMHPFFSKYFLFVITSLGVFVENIHAFL